MLIFLWPVFLRERDRASFGITPLLLITKLQINMTEFTEFLTIEESTQVDAALLSSKEKFATRLAIYALRVLKEIANDMGLSVEWVTFEQVRLWIKKDALLQKQIEVDVSFETFFTNLVFSSLRPLKQVSQESGIPLEELTVKEVIKWFEKEAKIRIEQGS
ncbi:MAG: hypothetical protein ACRCT1_17300 [Microcoleaceae cyanobacterium]